MNHPVVDIVGAAAATEDPVEVGPARPVGVYDGANGERGVPRQASNQKIILS